MRSDLRLLLFFLTVSYSLNEPIVLLYLHWISEGHQQHTIITAVTLHVLRLKYRLTAFLTEFPSL